MMLLPALNAMFDIATPRTEAARLHPPLMIFGMLGALFAGYDMAIRRRLNVLKSTDYDATGGMYSIGRGTSALSRLLAFDASFDKDGWKQRGATW